MGSPKPSASPAYGYGTGSDILDTCASSDSEGVV